MQAGAYLMNPFHTSLSLSSLWSCSEDRIVLECGERQRNGVQLLTRVAALSHALRNLCNVSEGDRVMLLGASSDHYIEALLASLDCGGIAVPINFRWSASDVAHAVQIAEPSIILFDDAFSNLVTCALEIICKSIHNRHQASSQTQLHSTVQSPGNQSLQLMPKLVALGRHQGQSGALLSTSQLIQKTQEAHPSATDSTSQLQLLGEPTVTAVTSMDPPRSLTGAISGRTLNMASSNTVNDFAKAPHGLQMLSPADGSALICFTSGTTGRPKGVVLTHYNFHVQSLAKLAAVQYCKEDVYLNTSPLFHVGGLSSLFANLMAGASQIVLPKFDAQSVLSVIKSRSVTSFIAVPTMIQDLIHHSETMARDERGRGRPSQELPQGSSALLSVQRILVGAGKISAEVMGKVKSLFPNAALYTAYGMTEACSSITFNVLHTPSQVRAQSQSHAIKVTSEDMDAQDSGAAPSISKDTTRVTHSHNSSWSSCAGLSGPGVEVCIIPPSSHEDQDAGVRSHNDNMIDHALQDRQHAGVRSHNDNMIDHALQDRQHETTSFPTKVEPGLAQGPLCELHGQALRVGEVWVRGAIVMKGYWREVEETNKVLSSNGWLRTGDLGYLDRAGRLWLMGRAKDMIKSGGENVYAAEVESVLSQHPAVEVAAVLGLPDERLGEKVVAVLTLKPTSAAWTGSVVSLTAPTSSSKHVPLGSGNTGTSSHHNTVLSEPQLQAFCRSQGLAGFKTPKLITVLEDPMPLNASGKLMKYILKQALLDSNRYNQDPHDLSHHSHRNQGLPKSTLIHSKL